MTLHINDPKFANERKDSKPLSFEEQKAVVDYMNSVFEDYNSLRKKDALPPTDPFSVQLLINHYENLQSLSDFIGGWEGATRLMNIVDPIPGEEKLNGNDESSYVIEVSGLKAGDKYTWPKPKGCPKCGSFMIPTKHAPNATPETVEYKCTNNECRHTETEVLEK